jgi:hypothetical protein
VVKAFRWRPPLSISHHPVRLISPRNSRGADTSDSDLLAPLEKKSRVSLDVNDSPERHPFAGGINADQELRFYKDGIIVQEVLNPMPDMRRRA